MYFGIANEIKFKKKKQQQQQLSGCALPLNRDLSIYFFDPDFLKLFFFCSEKSLAEKRKEKKSCYLFNMEAQDGQNTKENETLHGPTWNKVVKGKNYIKTD